MKPIEPPPGAQVFTQAFPPAPADIDENGHVNNVVYLRWVQEMAVAHWSSRIAPDQQALWAWVVLRHEIDYRRPLLPGEVAHARTWVGERRGPRFIRWTGATDRNALREYGGTRKCAPRRHVDL